MRSLHAIVGSTENKDVVALNPSRLDGIVSTSRATDNCGPRIRSSRSLAAQRLPTPVSVRGLGQSEAPSPHTSAKMLLSRAISAPAARVSSLKSTSMCRRSKESAEVHVADSTSEYSGPHFSSPSCPRSLLPPFPDPSINWSYDPGFNLGSKRPSVTRTEESVNSKGDGR